MGAITVTVGDLVRTQTNLDRGDNNYRQLWVAADRYRDLRP